MVNFHYIDFYNSSIISDMGPVLWARYSMSARLSKVVTMILKIRTVFVKHIVILFQINKKLR